MKKWKIFVGMLLLGGQLLTTTAPVAATPMNAYAAQATTRNGWVTQSSKKYYYVNGKKITGQKKIGSYWYMFHPISGYMITGFYNHTNATNPKGGPKTCYYDNNGHMLYGQRNINGQWYMFHLSSGAMIKGQFYKHNSTTNPKGGAKTCYYDNSGKMVKGQKKIGNYWYMFDMSSGAMKTGWFTHNSQTNPSGGTKKVYYNANGQMVYGWQRINGQIYFFNTGSGKCEGTVGENTTWIGDSWSYSASKSGTISSKLPGADVHAQVSKHFAYNGGQGSVIGGAGENNKSGLAILQSLKNSGKLRRVVVFALGTNDASGVSEANIQKVVDIAGKDRIIVFVGPRCNKYAYNNTNSRMKSIANKNSNVYYVNWPSSYTSSQSAGDGIHLKNYNTWVQCIVNEINKIA